MSKDYCSKCLTNLLSTIIKKETQNEYYRISLSKNKNYNSKVLCQHIDIQNTGKLTVYSISNFLKTHSFSVPDNLLKILIMHFNNYNPNNDLFLSYSDLASILAPKTYVNIGGDENVSLFDNLDYNLEEVAAKLIVSEADLINEVSKCLDLFYQDEEFVVYNIIRLLNNGYNSQFINSSMIEQFCVENKLEITHNELKIILYYFKANNENKIYYSQLKKMFKTFITDQNEFNPNEVTHSRIFSESNQDMVKTSSFINEYSKINIKTFLFTLLKYEEILYKERQNLYRNEEIIPIELFYIFDYENNNCITKSNFREVLQNSFNISPTKEEIDIIFHSYSYMDENRMIFDDFKRMFIPFDLLGEGDRLINPSVDTISNSSRNQINYFFKNLLTFEMKIEKIKKKFVNDADFSAYEEFLNLKNLGFGDTINKIDKRMLFNYLTNICTEGEYIDNKQLDILFNKLDVDRDYLISYEDFAYVISPIYS